MRGAREEAGPGGAGQRQHWGLEGCGGGPEVAQRWPGAAAAAPGGHL